MLSVNIQKKLDIFDLNIKFDVESGLTALFGPSGSGKSVTLKCIAGIMKPDTGWITLGDKTYYDSAKKINLPPQKRKVGFVFQNYALFPHLTVAQNIAFGITHLPKQEKQEVISNLIKKMNLTGLENKKTGHLSGGQQQRVALARTMATQPQILLLDEPFSALDSTVRIKLRGQLMELLAENPIPAILVTHDLNEAYSLSKKMVVIEGGKCLQQGHKDEIIYRPQNTKVAEFTRATNIFYGTLSSENNKVSLTTEKFSLTLKAENLPKDAVKLQVMIRPHLIRILPLTACLPNSNVFLVEIVKEIRHIDSYTLFLKQKKSPFDDYDFTAKVSAQVYQDLGLDQQKDVYCYLPPEHLTLIIC
jgi:molybdate transport system ATP-binding protein